MRNQQIFVASLFFLLGLPLPGMRAADDSIDRYVAAIGSIKSYDVTYRRLLFDLPDLKKPETTPVVWLISTNRDVLAVGLGRRFEENIGDTNHNIGILDLRTAHPHEAVVNNSSSFSFYLNPIVDGWNGRSLNDQFFLTELLTNQSSTINSLETSPSDSKLIGFQLNNPKLLRGGYVRVWLDPEHGYLPGKVEWYLQIENWHTNTTPGLIALIKRMQVDEFTHVDGKVWVPSRGSDVLITPVGQYKGRWMMGEGMEVDLEHSSWNSIKSDELFLPKSLLEVNYEKDGWKYDYSPAQLSFDKTTAAMWKKATRNKGLAKVTARLVLGAMSLLTLLFIIVLIARRRRGTL